MRCYKCGCMMDVPPDAPDEPDLQDEAASSAPAESAFDVDPFDFGPPKEAVSDPAAAPAASFDPAAFSRTMRSKMRQELRVILTEGGWLRFVSTHKLMLAVLGLAIASLVVRCATGSVGTGLVVAVVGAAVALFGFVPRTDEFEARAVTVTSFGGVSILLVASIYLLVRCFFVPSESSPWFLLPLLVGGVVAGALAVYGLISLACNQYSRVGVYPVLGWCYLFFAGLIPVSWDIVLRMPGIEDARQSLWEMAFNAQGDNVSADDEADDAGSPRPRRTLAKTSNQAVAAGAKGHGTTVQPAAVSGKNEQAAPEPPQPIVADSQTWEVAPDPLGQPLRQLGAEPLDLSVRSQNVVEVAFSAPQAGRVLVLGGRRATPQKSSSAAGSNVPMLDAAASNDNEPDNAALATSNSADAIRWIDPYDLATGRRFPSIELRPTSKVADVSLDGRQAVVVTADRLDVWSLDERKTLAGFRFTERGTQKIEWAKFVGPTQLATLDAEHKLVVSTIPDLGEVYKFEKVAVAGVSPGRKYLLLYAGTGEDAATGLFLEAATGKPCGRLAKPAALKSFAASRCAFSADGSRLAVAGKDALVVWDLKNGEVLCQYSPVLAENTVAFVDDDFVLVDKALVGLRQKEIVWNYHAAEAGTGWEKVLGSPDGRIWALAGATSLRTTYLTPVDLPDAQKRKELAASSGGGAIGSSEISAETLLGKKICLDIDTPSEAGAARPRSATPPPKTRSDEQVERESRQYLRRTIGDLIGGDEATLQANMHWLPVAKRPCIGLRWGLCLETLPPVELPNPRTAADLEKITAGIGAICTGLQKRIDNGAFGDWPRLGDAKLRRLAFLRNGKSNPELLAAAKRRGLDVLVILSYTQKLVGLKRVSENSLTVRLYDVTAEGNKPQTLWTSKPITSTEIKRALAGGPNPAADWVAEVLRNVDANFALKPMPAISAAAANKRITHLVETSSKSDDRLHLLLEARYYQSKQLLNPDEAAGFYSNVLGAEQGRILASGDEESRCRVVDAWLHGLSD